MQKNKYIEIDCDFIACPICGKELKNTKRSVNAHIGYWHKEQSKQLFHKEVEFGIVCKECNVPVANSNNVLSHHVRKEHKMETIQCTAKLVKIVQISDLKGLKNKKNDIVKLH